MAKNNLTAEQYVGKKWKDTSNKDYVVEVEQFHLDNGEIKLTFKGIPLLFCTLEYANEYFEPAE